LACEHPWKSTNPRRLRQPSATTGSRRPGRPGCRRYLALAVSVLACAVAVRVLFPQQSCNQFTGLFTETFLNTSNIDLTKSAAKFWYNDKTSPQHIVTMNKQGAQFAVSNPAYVPSWVNTVAGGDFDLDGWPDYVASSSSYSNVLAYVKNMGGQGQVGTFQISQWIDGSTGDASGWPTRGVGGAAIDTSGNCGMTAGDYDGDGDIDFLFIASPNSSPYTPKRIWLYRNNLITNRVNTGVLSFTQVDLTSAWASLVKGIAWSSTMMTSIDIDGDGDVDIVMGNCEGRVLKITNTGNGAVNAQTFSVGTTPIISTGWGLRGVSTVSVADFNNDGFLDIMVGSVSYNALLFYKNDGHGVFSLYKSYFDSSGNTSNNLYDGGATATVVADFDGDGWVDLVVGCDNWNYLSGVVGGQIYYFKNTGGDFTQTLIYNGHSKIPQLVDIDLGIAFDYNNDGMIDFLMADGNDSQSYVLFTNQTANVYNITGTATSANVTPALSSSQYAITQIQATSLQQRWFGSSSTGLTLTYYVSNNDGKTWELYAAYSAGGIANVTNQAVHSFSSFGTALRWKAVFGAAADSIPGFTNASYETPVIDQVQLTYTYVDKKEYSRTSDAATTLVVNSQTRKMIFSATFMFPGYQGQLRCYDVTDMGALNVAYSALQTVSSSSPASAGGRQLTSGVTEAWDAGQMLADRSPDGRTVYCGYRASAGATLQRKDFTTANTSLLASLLGDVNGDNAGLIDFIRGKGRDWKLGDIQHSNPVILGPPSGSATLMGTGYSAFVTTWAARPKVIFAGANDGMLHCFDAGTGTELWAFIPYNLLPKLKNLSIYDSSTGLRTLSNDYFVDGSPAVADIQIGGAWKTILICGQGKGKGSSVGGGTNYYFALDVTDVNNPQVLWEITAATMGETWSIPAIGRTLYATAPWAAFMGSGYNNTGSGTVGNVFYSVRVDTGATLKSFTAANVNTASGIAKPYADIPNAIPGSPTALDYNGDGTVEYVYVGDLDGRIWKFNAANSSTGSWTFTAIYTDRLYYPIITQPAVWVDPLTSGAPPRIYFGTGGDENAPADRNYAFIALKDQTTPSVEWFIGDPTDLGLASSLDKGTFGVGEKAWADPVISDNIVYFSTLKGSIENVNPCLNLADIGNLYARYLQTQTGGFMGATALKGQGNTAIESIQLTSKARRAVTLGERATGAGTSKREVYIQEYDSRIERLEQGAGSFLKIKSWREVYKIIR
jgi:hypothetical protein